MNLRISEEDYQKILENMPICCVDLIIQNKEKKFLLVLRKNKPAQNQWWFPGGRVYKNEKLEDAAIRKAKEETGLKTKIEKKIGVYETFFDDGPFPDLKTGVHTVNICFLASLEEDSEPLINGAHSDLSSFKWTSTIEKNLHPYIKSALKYSGIFSKQQ